MYFQEYLNKTSCSIVHHWFLKYQIEVLAVKILNGNVYMSTIRGTNLAE